MGQIIIPDAKGLFTDPNPFTTPAGALVEADNAVIDRPGIIQPRRGFEDAGMDPLDLESDGRVAAMTVYQDKLVLSHDNNLSVFNPDDNTRNEYSGTYDAISGERIRFAQANKNLYFTTDEGIKKLDAYTGTPIEAGMPRGISFTLAQSGTTGFQSANSQVGYRVLYGRKDTNTNIVYGAPSQRMVINGFANPVGTISGIARAATTVTITYSANHGVSTGTSMYLDSTDPNFPSGDHTVTAATATTLTYTESGSAVSGSGAFATYYSTRDVAVSAYLPDAAQVNDFLQVYRSAESVAYDVDPGEELGLVYEHVLTPADIAAGTFSFTDSTPDELRSTVLYTAPSQEGAIAENGVPPLARVVSPFAGSLLFGNTTHRASVTLRLLAVDAFAPIGLWIMRAQRSLAPVTILASHPTTESPGVFVRYTSGTPAQNVAATAASIVKAVNTSTSNDAEVIAYYASGPDDPPGIIVIEANDNSGSPVSVFLESSISVDAKPFYWSPALPVRWRAIGGAPSASRTGTTVTLTTAVGNPAHQFVVGQQVYVKAELINANFPDGYKVITAINVAGAKNIQYTEAGAATTSTAQFFVFPDQSNGTSPENHRPHRVMFSKADQPEHVPPTNYFDLGSADRKVLGMHPLKESLFIFKEDGLWRLRGSGPDTFSVEAFDTTVRLLAPDTVASVNNVIFAFTDKGVAMISETGVRIVSGPINRALLALTTSPFRDTTYARAFAVGYESDKKYILWMPTFASDTKATQAFIYDVATAAWTRWTKEAFFGLITPLDDILYISAGLTLSRERKSRTFEDQADEAVSVTISDSDGALVTLSSVADAAVGDVLYQSGLYSRITAVDEDESQVTLADADVEWTNASASILKAIRFSVRWAPIFGDSPVGQKHFKDVSIVIHDARVSSLDATFSTDQSVAEESVTITGDTSYATGSMRSYVALEKQRGNHLNIGIEHAVAYEVPSIAGFVLVAEGVSDRSRK